MGRSERPITILRTHRLSTSVRVLETAKTLGQILTERGETISVAETTTGGLISAMIVAVPGSSAYYDRGVVVYSKASKIHSLGIEPEALDRHGAVSEETAQLLAESVRRLAGTTYGLGETGIAGPIQGRSPKPIGTAYVALAGEGGTQVLTLALDVDREGIQRGIGEQAISFVVDQLR